jgi:hypothetical protein
VSDLGKIPDLREQAEKLASSMYQPHRFGDQAAWFDACVRLAMQYLERIAQQDAEIERLKTPAVPPVSVYELQNQKLKEALKQVWAVASGELQVAMDDTAGMEYLSDYVSTVWSEVEEIGTDQQLQPKGEQG